MKKLLIFLFLISAFLAYGQDDTTRNYGKQLFPDNLFVGDQRLDIANQLISGNDVLYIHWDTVTMWTWAIPSGGLLVTGKKLFPWKFISKDTMYITLAVVVSNSASPDFDYNVAWATDRSASGTEMFTTDPNVNGSDATSTGEENVPDVHIIPPNRWIWLVITDDTAIPEDGASFTFVGYIY